MLAFPQPPPPPPGPGDFFFFIFFIFFFYYYYFFFFFQCCSGQLLLLFVIGFPAHYRHLFIQFHQFPIQFRSEKLSAFKSKVQLRQIVIHIRSFVNQI